MTRLEQLNAPQRQAVKHTEGPLLILAGAGSGKTRVITYRLAYLIQSKRVPPQNLLAVTFTNKAANEMRERLQTLAGAAGRKVTLSTFHSLGVRILRQQAERAGYRKNFVIYDQSDQLSLVREIVKDRALEFAGHNTFQLLGRISSAKSTGESPESYKAKSTPEEALFGDLFEHYLRRTRQCNAVDFDDILLFANKVLEEHEDIRQHYQERFRYLMVDEYQDTNWTQFRFIELLLGPHRNLCVVGDDDQAIYSWRGANPEIMLQFEQHFPGARLIRLEQNYRSTGTILNAANAVIANNQRRTAKQLWTAGNSGSPITIIRGANELDEAEKIAGMIQNRKLMNAELQYGDFAVLVRTNFQLRPLEEAARAANLPYQLIGGSSFYERPEIRNLIAYLKVIKNPSDELSLKRTLQFPKRGIGAGTLIRLHAFCLLHQKNLFQAFREAQQMEELRPATRHAIDTYLGLVVKYQQRFKHEPISVATQELIKELDFIRALEEATPDPKAREAKTANVREFVGSLQRFEQSAEDKSLAAFLDRISLVTDSDYLNGKHDRVVFLTVHAAKGLEFPYVFLYGMSDGQFPSTRAIADGGLEEERRLCYVAITRAQRELFVSYSAQKTRYKEVLQLEPSRFLKEMPEELLDSSALAEETAEAQALREAQEATEVAEMLRRFRENNFKIN